VFIKREQQQKIEPLDYLAEEAEEEVSVVFTGPIARTRGNVFVLTLNKFNSIRKRRKRNK
jgi:hypothetical protein